MACKNMTEALLEDVIEITWMFDGLIEAGKIKSWDEILDQEDGSDGIKNTIKDIAQEFEKKYPFETTWEDTELDYIEEIEKLAAYDAFQLQNNIKPDYCNVGGLQMYDPEVANWVDWYLETDDDYFEDVDEYISSTDKADEIDAFTHELFKQIDWGKIKEMTK